MKLFPTNPTQQLLTPYWPSAEVTTDGCKHCFFSTRTAGIGGWWRLGRWVLPTRSRRRFTCSDCTGTPSISRLGRCYLWYFNPCNRFLTWWVCIIVCSSSTWSCLQTCLGQWSTHIDLKMELYGTNGSNSAFEAVISLKLFYPSIMYIYATYCHKIIPAFLEACLSWNFRLTSLQISWGPTKITKGYKLIRIEYQLAEVTKSHHISYETVHGEVR